MGAASRIRCDLRRKNEDCTLVTWFAVCYDLWMLRQRAQMARPLSVGCEAGGSAGPCMGVGRCGCNEVGARRCVAVQCGAVRGGEERGRAVRCVHDKRRSTKPNLKRDSPFTVCDQGQTHCDIFPCSKRLG